MDRDNSIPRRPASPASSVSSYTSATASFKRKSTDGPRVVVPPAVLKGKSPCRGRFEGPEIPVEDAMEYVSRPHKTWDSASRELARLESLKEQADDAMSTTSTISAYSIKSSASVTSSTSVLRGRLGTLPRSPPPPVVPDLQVGGSGMGGFSFVAPRASSSVSTVSAKSERVGTMAGAPSGKSGVRGTMRSETSRGGATATQPTTTHPTSAPGKMRDNNSSDLTVGGTPPATFGFQLSGQPFVPRMAPKKAK